MNLFILDTDVGQNARAHNDKHVVKMILEATQIASTVLWLSGGFGPYRVTHKNHPVVRWASASLANYRKTLDYGLALAAEYTHRFGKTHKCAALLLEMQATTPTLPDLPFTDYVYCGDDACQSGDTVSSYRQYYLVCKQHIAQWTRRQPPPWWQGVTA